VVEWEQTVEDLPEGETEEQFETVYLDPPPVPSGVE
jgi:hypothetical protein